MTHEEKTIKSEMIYEGRILNLRIDTVELPDRKYSKREIIEHSNAVAIVPIKDNKIFFVKQYRKAIEQILLEIPAGLLEVNESPKEGALREMQEEIGNTDLMVGNFETTSTPIRELSGFPMFNTPKETITNLKNSGLDILTTANNHCIDTGAVGIEDTINALDENSISHTGTWKKGERDYLIEEINGIKIGILAYTQRFNGLESLLREDEKTMINPIDEEIVKKDIDYLKGEKVDFIMVFPHWGEEYTTSPNEFQKNLAHKMIDWGADIDLGSHPHALQPIEVIEKDGAKKYIVYSLGNYISGQQEKYMGTSNTEAGLFVNLEIEKDFIEKKKYVKNFEVDPTWVREVKNDEGKAVLEVTFMKDFLEGEKLRDTASEENLKKVSKLSNNSKVILESMGYDTKIPQM